MPFPSLMPQRLTMEGMIENSNIVLDHAATVDRNGSMATLFQRAKGIMMISVVESAVILSGAAGTGICMVKDEATGKWSAPCSCGLAATGYGIGFGAQVKNMIIFAFDEKSVHSFTSKTGLKVNAGTQATLGTYGCGAGANLNVSASGIGADGSVANYRTGGTATICFTKGAFACAAVSGAVVGPRDHVNHGFYGKKDLTAQQILFGGTDVHELLPKDKQTAALEGLYEKLALFSKGHVHKVNPENFEETAGDVPVASINMIENVANEVVEQLDDRPPQPAAIEVSS
ncbi:unnamed protein product [Cylindrotheca closterium]|uniref:Ysc84 actin-binding domain-containing protein n=1 Tax=Cylindrotheca closterium TaxID=2856 RepID=A0AAD2FKM0_9STRA|nr:unnamed protein product [Cylindrotheca closterium]